MYHVGFIRNSNGGFRNPHKEEWVEVYEHRQIKLQRTWIREFSFLECLIPKGWTNYDLTYTRMSCYEWSTESWPVCLVQYNSAMRFFHHIKFRSWRHQLPSFTNHLLFTIFHNQCLFFFTVIPTPCLNSLCENSLKLFFVSEQDNDHFIIVIQLRSTLPHSINVSLNSCNKVRYMRIEKRYSQNL